MRTAHRVLLTSLFSFTALAGCSDDNGGTGPSDPLPPTGLTAQALGATSVQVAFTTVSGATRYLVQRAEGAAGGTFATVGEPTTPPFTDTGLLPNTTYRYQVATVSGTETSAFSSPVAVTTQDKPVEVITQNITTNTTWTSDKDYLLQGFIKVTNGATLIIEAGTTIRGDFNTLGSSLFVLRGARIQAIGTAANPIVFTSSRPAGQRQAGDWGGLILVGNGIINRGQPVILEGTGTGASNPAVDYSGGTDNADNSGTLRYVRIEFAGYATAPDAELNTLTLAAVGSGTTIEYVQGMNGLDDTFEWFGGAVDGRYLISYNAGDDHFDASEGYVGRNQYVIGFQQIQVVPRPQAGNVSNDPQGFENDGCAGANCLNGQLSQPYTIPMFANFTLVGPPAGVNTQGSGNIGMMLRRGTGGYYVNGVVARWSRAAISLRDQSTLDRITAGDLALRNLALAQNGAVFQPQTGGTVQGTVDEAANAIESVAGSAASLFTSLPATPASGTLDWSPSAASAIRQGGLAAFTGAIAAKAGTFVTATAYRGAADPNGAKWWQGWTNYAEN